MHKFTPVYIAVYPLEPFWTGKEKITSISAENWTLVLNNYVQRTSFRKCHFYLLALNLKFQRNTLFWGDWLLDYVTILFKLQNRQMR
jgi:hypothetical protein